MTKDLGWMTVVRIATNPLIWCDVYRGGLFSFGDRTFLMHIHIVLNDQAMQFSVCVDLEMTNA